MEATDLEHGDPVSSTARHFLRLRQHNADPDTTICSYYPATGVFPEKVTSTNIVSLLCLHSLKLGFQRLYFYPHDIVSHLLRSGGAMTLHQAHICNNTIKINGRWRSYDFLIYL